MKRLKKLGLASVGLLAFVFVASSCTASFCTTEDKSRILFAVEPGVSTYYDSEAAAQAALDSLEGKEYSFKEKVEGSNFVWRVVAKDADNNFAMYDKTAEKYVKLEQLTSIISTATNAGAYRPSDRYFAALDQKVLIKAFTQAGALNTLSNSNAERINSILTDYGYVKFHGNEENWENYDKFNKQLIEELPLGIDECPSEGFVTSYKKSMESTLSGLRSCITTVEGQYGNYGQFQSTIKLSSTSWGDAWHKGGAVIEGLIVYPVAWMVDQFAYLIAGGSGATAEQISSAYQGGVPQLLALLIVTVIVRLFIFLVSFKSTLSQQKMQQLQPELAKIQQKYPNSNTNRAQKQRLSEEQMKLYKKHHINPLSQLLVLIIQFPVFIGVWGAMTGSAVLSTGAVLNLNLSTSIWNALTHTNGLPSNDHGWWTALVLIILMSVSQFLAMKIPQWIAKARTKKVARLGKNPAQTQQNRTANIISYVMIIMIIVMGFTLPAAMGVYWLVGALVSLAQSLIIQFCFTGRKHKK